MSLPNPPFTLVGKWSGRRLDSQQKLSGQMQFGNDFNIPGQAYMKILHSQIPMGTISSMDTTAAKAMPGVIAVVTPTDIKNDAWWSTLRWSSVPVLPYDKIRVSGEEIAAVLAEDPYVAEQACQAIKVTYQPSNFVLHPLDAAKSTAPQVYDGTSNLGTPTVFTFGDADTAMKDTTATIYSKTFEFQHLQHNNVNSWAFVVRVDMSGRTEMWSSNQYAKSFQASIAQWLNVAQSRIRVYNNSADGAFGDKSGTNRAHMLGVYLSQKTGRPVKYRCSHEDNLILGNHRVKNIFQMQIAYKADGTITAVEGTIYGDSSAFGGGGSSGSALELYAVYKFPNFKITTYDVVSNTGKSGPLRCVADPYACQVINTGLDEIANKLGMKYTDLIAKNTLYGATGPYADKDQQTSNRIPSCGLPDCLSKAVSNSNFASKWKAAPKSPSGLTGVKHGIGLGLHSCGHGSGSSTSAVVVMRPDGSLEVHADSNELGQAKREELAIVAAEAMGLPFNMVTLDNYSSDDGTDTGVSAGSTQTKRAGSSIGAACLDAKNQMLAKAATSLNTTVDKLTYAQDGSMKIFLTADPTKSVTFASLTGEPMIVGVGHFILPSKITQRTYAAAVAEIDVDTDTGLITVNNIWHVQDVGRVLYRAGLIGQGYGGVIQSIGQALQEDQWPDIPTGKQLIISHLDHKMPITTQIPTISVDFVETVEQFSTGDSYNFGAKGAGEPFTSPTGAAIGNAIGNAIGWWPDTYPVSPEKILKAVGKA